MHEINTKEPAKAIKAHRARLNMTSAWVNESNIN